MFEAKEAKYFLDMILSGKDELPSDYMIQMFFDLVGFLNNW